MLEAAEKARNSGVALATLTGEQRNQVLENLKQVLIQKKDEIILSNSEDVEAAEEQVAAGKLSSALVKRLGLSGSKWDSLISGLDTVIALEDPLGQVSYHHKMCSDGLDVYRVSCPIGVVCIIFEARPEAAIQIAALAIKSGNALLLKGGKEAAKSNAVLVGAVREALHRVGGERIGEAVQLVDSREDVNALLKMDEHVDVIIPRGSNSLVRFIKNNTTIPVLGHADGICHIYIHEKCDLQKVNKVVVDAKTQYPAACNTTETVLIDSSIASSILPNLVSDLRAKAVEVKGCSASRKIVPDLVEAVEEDFRTEWCDLKLSVKIVEGGLKSAIEHINGHGSHHTDCILTEDPAVAEEFMQNIDSAGVYWNASTRFADGFRYGFGAEIGVSTNRIHARGPMGLEGLCIYKYRVYGRGHTVAEDGKRLLAPSKENSDAIRSVRDLQSKYMDAVGRKPEGA